MRKALYLLFSLVIGILIHVIVSRYMSHYGVGPQLLLLFVVANGFFVGPLAGATLGFFWGLLIDSMSVNFFGLQALLFSVAGYVCGKLRRRVASERPNAQLVIGAVVSVYYFLAAPLVRTVISGTQEPFSFWHVFFGVVLNVLLVTGVFWLAEFWANLWKIHQENL